MAFGTQKKTPQPHKPAGNAPVALKLLFVVVSPNKAEYYADLMQAHGVNLSLLCQGNGTVPSSVAAMLGLTETGRTVLIGTLREDAEKEMLDLLDERFRTIKNGKGIAFTVAMASVIGATFYQFLCEKTQ